MRSAAQKTARFGLLTALALVLGLLDRAVPLSALLGGAVPGIKLGLANTVLLYAVFLMDWKSAVLLMLTKVLLSGLLYGSLSAVWFSLSGGVLSLAAMFLFRSSPARGALTSAFAAAAALAVLLVTHPRPRGQVLLFAVLLAAGLAVCLVLLLLLRRGVLCRVQGTSVAGAAAHNIGQVLAAFFIVRTPLLLNTYLPALVGIGVLVGCLTGIVTDRVLKVLRLSPPEKKL